MVLGILFLSQYNSEVKFTELRKFIWRSYTIAKVLPTPSWVELIDKREFVKAAIDENSETFIMHVLTLNVIELAIHPFRAA